MISFPYFEGPEAEMPHLISGEQVCDLCGRRARCFELVDTLRRPPGASTGCVDCLRSGSFGFFHITEAGDVEEHGLVWYERDDDETVEPWRFFVAGPSGPARIEEVIDDLPASPPPDPPDDVAVEELRRTPDFGTSDEVPWLVHCRDFMVYLGTWQLRDIQQQAAARPMSAADLLSAMTDGKLGTGQLEGETSYWGRKFHAFRCRRCAALRGLLEP